MTSHLPACVVGTSQVSASARNTFGEFLDAAAAGFRGTLLTEGSAWVWDTLRQGTRRGSWDVWALVPHVAGYVREVSDHGMMGAGWRRVRRLNPLSGGRLFFQGMLNIGGVLRRDFPTLLSVLIELELANFRGVRPGVVFLHPQMTDLLLAMDNGAALTRIVKRMARGFGTPVGLATNNLGTLLPKLRDWRIEVPFLLSELHQGGYGMRPDRGTCEVALREYEGNLIATTGDDMTDATAGYWKSSKVSTAVYLPREPRLAEWRRWQAWRSGSLGPTMQPITKSETT